MTKPGRSAIAAFIASEAAGGIVLMAASALALLVANSPLAGGYFGALHAYLGPLSVQHWINDALMAVFFLLVGLEIKREWVAGELAGWDRRRLPVVAAAAGMVVPALVYLAVTASTPGLARGWAIPAATDIAFAIGVLAILGRHAPLPLKLLLTTIAVVDDMGAVAIIAVVYTAALQPLWLAAGALVLVQMGWMGRRGITRLAPYLVAAGLLWVCMFQSGVHATIAGVLAAMMIPIRGGTLERLEHGLHPWVAFGVVPLFGFANAGVSLEGVDLAALLAPLPLGIAAGLVIGKQAGIFGAILVADRLKIARAPDGVSWTQLYGMALLAGIGFTMSLFIGGLAFPGQPELSDAVKIGVLAGSLLSALAGYAVLRLAGQQGTSTAR